MDVPLNGGVHATKRDTLERACYTNENNIERTLYSVHIGLYAWFGELVFYVGNDDVQIRAANWTRILPTKIQRDDVERSDGVVVVAGFCKRVRVEIMLN